MIFIFESEFFQDSTVQDIKLYWIICEILLNLAFLVKLVLRIVTFGIAKAIHERLTSHLEIIMQIICFFHYIKLALGYYVDILQIMQLVALLRLLRLLTVIERFRAFEILFKSMRRLASPFYMLLFTLYTLNYVFAMVGMTVFGGLIRTDSEQAADEEIPELYFMLNFNDFISSMITLNSIIIISNWYSIV